MDRLKRVICFICVLAISVAAVGIEAPAVSAAGMETPSALPGETPEIVGEGYGIEAQDAVKAVSPDYGTEAAADTTGAVTRVLLVGNSFTKTKVSQNVTYSVQQPLEEMAAADGRSIKVHTLAHGLARLSYYAGMKEDYISYHKQLMRLLLNRKWDYIIFQERTAEPIQYFETSTYPAVQRLQELVKTFQPNAKMLLYMNAGYSNGVPIRVNGTKRLLSTEEMELYLAAAFKELENRLGIEAVMVGMHSHRVNILYPHISMVRTDDKHPEYAGYFLAACCFYQKIYKALPYSWGLSLTNNRDLSERELFDLSCLPIDSLELNKKNVVLKKGKTASLKTIISSRLPQSYKVTYKSFDKSIASVDPHTGLVKGKKEGSTVVYAESADGLQAFCNVTVRLPLSFIRSYYVAGKGDRLWVKPQTNQGSLRWLSSKTKVATVNPQTGLVKAKNPGKTVIKVFDQNKPSDKASYTLYVACNAPGKLKTGSVKSQGASYTNIKVSWGSVKGASGYEVYRSVKKGGKYRSIGTTKKLSFVDKTAKPNKRYYYKVMAKNSLQHCASPLSKSVQGRRKRVG